MDDDSINSLLKYFPFTEPEKTQIRELLKKRDPAAMSALNNFISTKDTRALESEFKAILSRDLEHSMESCADLMGDKKKIIGNKEQPEKIDKKKVEMDLMATNEPNATKEKMWWQKYHIWIIIGVILTVVIIAIVIIAEQDDDE